MPRARQNQFECEPNAPNGPPPQGLCGLRFITQFELSPNFAKWLFRSSSRRRNFFCFKTFFNKLFVVRSSCRRRNFFCFKTFLFLINSSLGGPRQKLGRDPRLRGCTWGRARIREFANPGVLSSIARAKSRCTSGVHLTTTRRRAARMSPGFDRDARTRKISGRMRPRKREFVRRRNSPRRDRKELARANDHGGRKGRGECGMGQGTRVRSDGATPAIDALTQGYFAESRATALSPRRAAEVVLVGTRRGGCVWGGRGGGR